MLRWLRRRDNQRGAVLVEAAFVFPLLVMLTVGIWSTARAWNIHNVMNHASKEAARHGATVAPWDGGSSVHAVIDRELAASRVDPASVTRCVYHGTGSSCVVGDTTTDPKVQVALTFPDYRLSFVFFSFPVDLEAGAVSRWEGD